MEWILIEAEEIYQWPGFVSTYPDMLLTQAAFMDDLLLWDGTSLEVQTRLCQLQNVCSKWGLGVNIEKCSLYVSPKHKGPSSISIGGTTLTASSSVEVMGVNFKVGANVQELLAPTWQRAKNKFWSIKHLLCAPTPLSKRMNILDRVVGGSILWNVSSFAPEKSALQGINQILYQMVIWMLRLRKHGRESWMEFRMRSYRQARQIVFTHMRDRWSTQWLGRWWNFAGHAARGAHLASPTCSSVLLQVRDLGNGGPYSKDRPAWDSDTRVDSIRN